MAPSGFEKVLKILPELWKVVIIEKQKTCSMFLLSFSINLLPLYQEGRSPNGHATHFLFEK